MTLWDRARHADRRPALLARNRIAAAFRRWLEVEGFTEADPSALVASPGNEVHLHAFSVSPPEGPAAWLHTSPEFAMKKLLAAGETRLFALSPVFRARETGSPLHAPAFTMLEWYRSHTPYETLFEDVGALLREAATVTGAAVWRWRDRSCDPLAPPDRLTVAEAFQRHAGVDLLATLGADGRGDRDGLARQLGAQSVRVGEDDTWSDLFARVLVQCVEPHLGAGRATILHDYPLAEAALARPAAHDPRLAERFELYVCGVELANGFGELTDPSEQRRRFEADMAEKARRYGERYPIDEDFIAALGHMPPASGCALGFDRLVMLATGAPDVRTVMWAP
ncbi:MAG: EF-P lysine aminoacylase EpmA [Hyphomonadaceae bacterium]|nr:EF-P lysine aminoacylase EpmA [Hyphomonadaceae bacterium]